MKKIAIVVLSLFFILALIDGVIQSSWAKKKTFAVLKKNLQSSGWDLEIDNIHTTFPIIDLEGVTLSAPDFVLRFKTIQTEISLARLWKKEIIFTKLNGDSVTWSLLTHPSSKEEVSQTKSSSLTLSIEDFSITNGTLFEHLRADVKGSFFFKKTRKNRIDMQANGEILPTNITQDFSIPWEFSTHIARDPNKIWTIEKTKVESQLGTLKGFGRIDIDGNTKGSIDLKSRHFKQLDPIEIGGQILAHLDIEKQEKQTTIVTTLRIPSLHVESLSLHDLQGKIDSIYKEGSLQSRSSFKTEFLNYPWQADIPFSWNPTSGLIVTRGEITSDLLKFEGNLEIPHNAPLSINARFITNQLHPFFPQIYGEASGTIEGSEEIHIDAKISDFHFDTFSAKTLSIHSDLRSRVDGNLICDIVDGKWHHLTLDTATIETSKKGNLFPFEIIAKGSWVHPIDLELNGFWKFSQKEFFISLENGNGSFFNHPIALSKPTSFTMSPDRVELSDFAINMETASLFGSFLRKESDLIANLNIQKLPLDFLSLNPLDVEIDGTFDLDLSVQQQNSKLTGNLFAEFNNLEMHLLGQTDPLNGQGALQGSFNQDQLIVNGNLKVRDEPLLQLNLNLPIHFSLWPFQTEILSQSEVSGHFYLKGRVEEFLDFFNLGSHRLEGGCVCDLNLSNTLETPHLYGQCSFHNGYYQNYYTGTELHNIQAIFDANKDLITLRSLTSQDLQDTGTLDAKGKIDLLPEKKFPFEFNATFSRFNWVTFDLIATETDGHIELTGNISEATATGELQVVESDLTIPARIPKKIPDLEVVYKNTTMPPFLFKLPTNNSYPLHLDLSVDAPDGIFISGRGLDSEWKGKFHVGGTQTDIATEGKIELIKGNFLFSGKAFKLTEGSLSFSGKPDTYPFLNLAADIQVKDILITAHLRGPLNNPQVTLQSSPPLPMGTIMSYLLFGQDLAEINSFQALQLATSIATIAGEGPGILEQTKKSLGVDRIQMITIPSATSDTGETFAIQVGKYVTEDVLVSLSQGAEFSSTNISIEVELQGNLSLILESDQADEQKQGKFTLRWAHTY